MKTTQQIIDALRSEAPVARNTAKEAADTIEALLADLKKGTRVDCCEICAHGQKEPPCVESEFMCDVCAFDCQCKDCRGNSKFEWRGVQSKEQTKEEEHE